MITVDGEPVTGSQGDDPADIMRKVRVELKCCKALMAMKPPHDLSAPLHVVDEIEKRAGQSDGRPPGTTCSLTPPSASPATRS